MTANINLSLFAIFPSVLRCCVALEKCEYYVVSPLTPTNNHCVQGYHGHSGLCAFLHI
jgi:hypothetical protein